MKKDLFTVLVAGVLGIIAAYFVANLLLPEIGNVAFKTLTGSTTYTLTSPNEDIFNYRAVNPTVEVYVGECTTYNENGECIDNGINNNETTEDDEHVDTGGETAGGGTDETDDEETGEESDGITD